MVRLFFIRITTKDKNGDYHMELKDVPKTWYEQTKKMLIDNGYVNRVYDSEGYPN